MVRKEKSDLAEKKLMRINIVLLYVALMISPIKEIVLQSAEWPHFTMLGLCTFGIFVQVVCLIPKKGRK